MVHDRPIRFTQDLLPSYGSEVRAFEVLDLSATNYEERQVGTQPVLRAGNATWNQGGMHHIDAHVLSDGSWIACVDGWIDAPASLKNLAWVLSNKFRQWSTQQHKSGTYSHFRSWLKYKGRESSAILGGDSIYKTPEIRGSRILDSGAKEAMRDDFEVTLGRSLTPLVDGHSDWDQLLAISNANTIFLTPSWLRASFEIFGRGQNLLIPQAWRGGKLIGAAAFQENRGVITFVGNERSDYLDFVLPVDLDSRSASEVVQALLAVAQQATPGFRCFVLRRIPVENGTPTRLETGSRYFATLLDTIIAPSMDMSAADEKLRKKSLRRHERILDRLGELTTRTFTRADEILPRLDEFFDQHARRWQATPYPSLFLDPVNREFYQQVTRNLDSTTWLRFTEMRLDQRLVAAHFGFFHAGRFIWYKPSFEPELARYSPGEVLLKRLIECAQSDGASEFDFTIGDESFKRRFATKIREVAEFHITDSRVRATSQRIRQHLRHRIRRTLDTERLNQLKRRIRRAQRNFQLI